jgi:hypothetical protein
MPAQRPGHRVSSAHLQAAYPFVAEGGLGSRGVYIGRDLHGGSFVYDPWELYGRELTDPNMVLVGHVGSAKSSLVKTLIYRQHVFGRLARVIDVKREYAPLAHALGGTVIQLRPGGTVRLNPLTPLAGSERQLELLRAVTIATLRRRLAPEEDASLRVALQAVTTRLADAEATLPDVVAALLEPTAEMADALVTTPEALATAARDCARAICAACSMAPRRRGLTSTRRSSCSTLPTSTPARRWPSSWPALPRLCRPPSRRTALPPRARRRR